VERTLKDSHNLTGRSCSWEAVDCALAGIRAVDPCTIVVDALAAHPLDGEISIVSVGKAAAAMARGAWSVLGGRIANGVIIAPTSVDPFSNRLKRYVGGHPIPTDEGERGARDIVHLAQSLRANDTLLCLISGGASALMTCPVDGVSLADMQALTSQLLRAGATISELNCVRKHIDCLKGGRLASLAAPARVIALILSDVVGDPLDVIASGPTVPDTTTIVDAMRILHERMVWNSVPPAIRRHLEIGVDESPKAGDPCFATVTSTVIGNNTKAAEAARIHAVSLGYDACIVTTALTGESRDVGAVIARDALALQARVKDHTETTRRCFIYAGETTVTVVGSGVGGRNQELVLSAAIVIDGSDGITITSIGTDGIDGPTDAAGAVADGDTIGRARTLGLDAFDTLANNDAYPFWSALGDLVVTGPTGTLIVVTID
jgi:hydroxypyruvate reductase